MADNYHEMFSETFEGVVFSGEDRFPLTGVIVPEDLDLPDDKDLEEETAWFQADLRAKRRRPLTRDIETR